MNGLSHRVTQRAEILQLLISERGGWISLPRIAHHAKQYNARLFELRRLGFPIENKTKTVDGVRHSWFRLQPSKSADRDPVATAQVAETSIPATLFGDISPDRTYTE